MKFTNENIIKDPHPGLRKKCLEVALPLSKLDLEIAKGLHEYVVNSTIEEKAMEFNLSPAVGIAAPQVDINKRICVVYFDDEDNENIADLILINPKIISHSIELVYIENGEACLSINETYEGIVERFSWIKVAYIDIEGTKQTIEATGFKAIALQHEIDHLNGVLFYDHINSIAPNTPSDNSFPL